ncbi:MAG: tetratricopeptide repeat protein, partial [Deltaproteobacteria bacterium]|nr:tetratricopeptide repeat protein [Deltaproteobacteria bacterium]
ALDGLEEVAREIGRFDLIAEAFRSAPATKANLAVLSEALERTGEWKEFASVRRREARARGDDDERARLLLELGGILEEEVHDLDAAIEIYRETLDLSPGSAPAQDALARLLESQQSWPDLEKAWREEAKALSDEEPERKIALYLRLGELRETRLDDLTGAVDAYRAALELGPLHVPTLDMLERIYKSTGQTYDLAEILGKRAEASEDARDRAAIYRRLAELLAPTAVDRAAEAWEQSFRADPSSREIFTGMEKFCYEHQRWDAAMQLYNLAIGLVEDGSNRAFRLSDLYSRRGHVELQFKSDPAAAAASYTRVVEIEPDDDTAIKYIESIYSQLEDWDKLIEVYDKQATLAADPDRRVEAFRRAARIAATRLSDSTQAAKLYDRVLDLDAADGEALDALEEFATESRDWNKLVEVLRKRLESAPAGDAATGLLRRIAKICEERLRDEERAITYYQRILEIAPGHRSALEALGRIYESTERWADFVDVTRRQIKVTTDRAHKALLYFKCGSVMEAKFGEEDEAIRYYEAAIKTSPSCMPAVHGLRDMYRRREDWPKVVQTLELEVKLWDDDKERAGVFAQIGQVYGRHLGHRDRALHYYESALAVDPDCLPANRALFEEYFTNGDWERALPLANALAQKAMREGDPNARSEFYRKRGIVCRMTGDARAAAESIIVALEIRPASVAALDALTELVEHDSEAYDFESTYRELTRIYSRRDDSKLLQARVNMGKAILAERNGDLETAERVLAQASALAPRDAFVLKSVVNLHRRMRRFERAVDAIVKFLEPGGELLPDDRAEVLMLQAEVHAQGQMDSHRAISVLRDVIRLKPSLVEPHYRLAQELFILGRYSEAKSSVEEVISLVAAPGEDVSPKLLARYYYYLGRILEASGDHRSAASQYRRAADYDPAYSEPILALAKRSAVSGDLATAQTTLINAAHQAIEAAGKMAAVPMQRGLARLQLASGDPAGAIDAYRGMLAVNPDDIADRIALSELYVYQDLRKAIRELLRVVDRDIRIGPVYKQLAGYYSRGGKAERVFRVQSIMEALGFADKQDLTQLSKARSKYRPSELVYPVDDELRRKLLITDIARSLQGELLAAMESELAGLFPTPPLGENLQPALHPGGDRKVKKILTEAIGLFGVEPEVYLGEGVPGGMVAMSSPRPILVLDRNIVAEGELALRFLAGYGFEAIRGKYAVLLMLSQRQLSELHALLGP